MATTTSPTVGTLPLSGHGGDAAPPPHSQPRLQPLMPPPLASTSATANNIPKDHSPSIHGDITRKDDNSQSMNLLQRHIPAVQSPNKDVAEQAEPAAPASSAGNTSSTSTAPSSTRHDRPTILHLGDPITYHPEIYARLASNFHIIRPPASDLSRPAFISHLKRKTWGSFAGIMKPFWASGGDMHPWDRELIDLLPDSMRVMAGAGAGFDWVDTAALAERGGILYCNGAHASTESVANTALFHLIGVFTFAGSSHLAAHAMDPAHFRRAHVGVPQISRNPSGQVLGIVGLGSIGQAIARGAHLALGMRILYYDIQRKSPAIESSCGNATFCPTIESLFPLCTGALLLATPGGPPLLTAHTLTLLPRGARVVNIARGSLIDESALAAALDSGHISAAGLDVHANEPYVHNRLASMGERVLMTCHTGGASRETNAGFERLSMENVEAVLLSDGGGGGGGRGRALTAVNQSGVDAYWARASGLPTPTPTGDKLHAEQVGEREREREREDLHGPEGNT